MDFSFLTIKPKLVKAILHVDATKGLVDLSTHGGKMKFEIGRPAKHCLGSQNSNLIFPPYVLKSTRPTFL